MNGLFEAVITPSMAGLAAAAIAVMFFIGKIPYKSKKVNETKLWGDWGDFILVVICTASSFAPGVNQIPVSEWGGILIFAAVSALAAHLGRKILKPIILTKLEGKK